MDDLLETQQPFRDAEVVNGLCNPEQGCYHDHSACAAFEERRRTLVLHRFSYAIQHAIVRWLAGCLFDNLQSGFNYVERVHR